MGQWEDAHLLEAQPVSTRQTRGGFQRVAVVLFCVALLAAAAGAAGPLASRRAITSRGAALLAAAAKGNGTGKGKSAAKALPAPEPEGEVESPDVLEAPELPDMPNIELPAELGNFALSPDVLEAPELPEMPNIEPAELGNFVHELKELPTVGNGESPPPMITSMTADDWTMVYSNTNVLRGMHSDPRSLDHAWLFLLLPPKQKCAECILTEQKAYYTATVSQDEKYSKAAQIGSQTAFNKISSPYVSFSSEYLGMGQQAAAEMGSTVIIHQKFMAPVVTLKLEPGIHVRRYAGDGGRFAVNPEFAELAGQLVQKHNGSCSSLREAWKKEVGKRFGEIYAASVKIGVGADRIVTKVMRSKQDLVSVQKVVKAAIGGSIPEQSIKSEVGGGSSSSNQTEDGHQSSEQSQTWTCTTGSGAGCDDPTAVSDYRSDPNSWRVLRVDKFLPVTDLLPPKVVDQLNEVCWYEWAFSREAGGCRGTYTGPLKDGVPSGQGKCVRRDHVVYVGEFKDGMMFGQGKMTTPSDDVYEGEVRDGLGNGLGDMTFEDGSSYSGEWRDGYFNGQGKKTSVVGNHVNHLEGQWKNGTFVSGQGKMEFSGGESYTGEWRDGQPNGQGKGVKVKNGNVTRMEGQWKNGKFVSGHGKTRFVVKHNYAVMGIGEWDKKERMGDYEGELMRDSVRGIVPHGEGKITWDDGTVQEGFFETSGFTGVAVHYPDGTVQFCPGWLKPLGGWGAVLKAGATRQCEILGVMYGTVQDGQFHFVRATATPVR